ncbi:MAG: MATE family efflux transporter [Clostridiales bacterium]|nr:MATE family efflux transporter [Clostridiales bacterium]
MAKNATRDMTVGSPMKLILGFSVPLLMGFLFQQFYSLVDTVIVGKILGVDALAAVGSTGSVNFMVIGFCMGVCSGFSIPIAHMFGAKDYVGMRKYVANSVWLSGVFAVVMTIAVCVLCRSILVWMKTPSDIIEQAYEYIFIIFLGIPVTYLYNMLSGIIRSLGDAKTPVMFLVMSAVLNIFLDLFLILVIPMGVAGAAWATVISQGVSGVCCLFYMRKKFEILHIRKEEWKTELQLMKNLCNMGIPMGLQYSVTAIGSIILQTAVNTLGSLAVASITASNKIGMFFCCPYDAMGSTMATYGGQNVGAKRLDRVHQGMKACVLLGAVYSVFAFGVLSLFGKDLAHLFVDSADPKLSEQVGQFLFISSMFYFPLALVNIVRFMIQGLGFSKFAILAGVCEMVARALAGFLLVPRFGFIAACYASPLAWILADLFLIPAYFHVMKRLSRMFGLEEGTRQYCKSV